MVTFSQPQDCRTFRFHSVVQAAKDRLDSNSSIPSRQISCEYRQGVLLLRGRLLTYYQKQVAQEAVRGLNGVRQVVNEIEVAE
jgi:osmotically-inducible protein OsmY